MTVSMAGLVLIGLWLVAAFRGISSAAYLTLVTIPLGAAAVVVFPANGLSVLALQALASLTTLLCLLQLLARGRGGGARLPLAAWVLAGICIYGAVTAFAMPRLFLNEILVVPYQRAIDGVRLSEAFYTTLIPLAPTASNISQPGYLFASLAFFLVMLWTARAKGAGYLSSAILAAAGLNAILGLMDMLRLDQVLAFIRTADYAIAANWSILGADRLIGGFPEPSSFGSTSAVFAAYGLSIFLDRRDWIAGLVGVANAVLAVLALSTTGWLGLGVAGLLLAGRTVWDALSGASGKRAGTILIIACPIALAAVAAIVLTPAGQYAMDMADRMIFSKGESASGLERGTWAREGYRVFQESFGFGAGLGSVRSNGLIPVILANIGWPGMVLSVAFLWLVFWRPARFNRRASSDNRRRHILFRAAWASAMTALAMMATTAVIVDPGILFFALSAISVSVRPSPQPAASRSRTRAYVVV
jgi:hypothetical protein